MVTVKELKEYLNKLQDDENLYIGYSDDDELVCTIYTEEAIKSEAEDKRLNFDDDEDEDGFTDIDTALTYLADMDTSYHYMEIDL